MAGCFSSLFRRRKPQRGTSEKPRPHLRPVRISDIEKPLLATTSSTSRARVPYRNAVAIRPEGNHRRTVQASDIHEVKAKEKPAVEDDPELVARRKKAEQEEQERLDFFQML
ncbi:hypothetical protein VTI74DRAFT_7497 [Chaetomium olivicolor]